MTTLRQVTCIKKHDRQSPYQRITHLGCFWGPRGEKVVITEDEAIDHIQRGTVYYVKVGMRKVNVFIVHRDGRNYLRTTSDDTVKDNLLSLEEC